MDSDALPVLYIAKVEPEGLEFEAPSDQPLLLSAEMGDVLLPSSCRNGTCRTCLCKMLSGSVEYRIDWPGVSEDEREEGWILPCVAYPQGPVVLDVPDAKTW